MNERKAGKEQIKVKVDKLLPALPLAFFGDPLAGDTAYALCLYGERDALVAALRVDRAQQQCGKAPCWKPDRTTGFKYADKLLAADGVQQLAVRSGAAGSGRVVGKAKRNLEQGLVAMPVGVAAQLAGNTRATVQLVTSDGACISGTADRIEEATALVFKGKAP